MRLEPHDLRRLADIGIATARQTGEIIVAHATRQLEVIHKDSGDNIASQVVTEVDYLCDSEIRNSLQACCRQYDLGLLTEETEDDRQRLQKEYFWCADPMDGTLSFIESQPGYSVSIALVSRHGEPVIGIIHDPFHGVTYSAVKGQGAYIDAQPWQLDYQQSFAGKTMTLVCDRGFIDCEFFPALRHALERIALQAGYAGMQIRVQTGAALNAIWVLQHQPALYIKCPKAAEGGGSIWDFAASAAIYNELGACASSFSGSPLDLNNPSTTYMNRGGVLYCQQAHLHAAVSGLRPLCLS